MMDFQESVSTQSQVLKHLFCIWYCTECITRRRHTPGLKELTFLTCRKTVKMASRFGVVNALIRMHTQGMWGGATEEGI